MVGLQSTAALAALLAGVVVAFVYRLAPSGSAPRFSFALRGERCAVFPVGVLLWVLTQKCRAAFSATKKQVTARPCAWASELPMAVVALMYEIATIPGWVGGTAICLKEAFTGAILTAAPANFARQGFKCSAAYLAGAKNFLFFGLPVANRGTVFAMVGGAVEKYFAALRAGGFYKFHITLLAQGVGLFSAGQFVAKNEDSETLIRHCLAPQVHYTTGGA